MDAAETVREYYDALRAGDPLGPFFVDPSATARGGESVVKYGISERLVGAEAVRAGLADQTATTTGWTVESDALRATERACHAWFSDDVFMAWTDTERGVEHEFETRWSGTLEARSGGALDPDGEWRFVGMHVSVPGEV